MANTISIQGKTYQVEPVEQIAEAEATVEYQHTHAEDASKSTSILRAGDQMYIVTIQKTDCCAL